MARILIVDDSSTSRRIIKNILEPAGHTIIEATDGLSALERYFLDRPDLVMLDLIMGGMYGLDVLRKLIELDQNAKVVIASADIQDSTRSLAQQAGSKAFITKPFKTDELINTVRSVLEGIEQWS